MSVSGPVNSPPFVSRPGRRCMAFREVPVFEVREVMRLWRDGQGLRSIEAITPPDRKTIRRVVDVAVGLGLDRDGDVGQLDDVFVSSVMAGLAVSRPDRLGASWTVIAGDRRVLRRSGPGTRPAGQGQGGTQRGVLERLVLGW